MYTDNIQSGQNRIKSDTACSYFTNEYILTKEMCAQAEVSRIDIGIAYVSMTAAFVFLVILFSASETFLSFSDAVQNYFASPSVGTVLELSGPVGITFVSPLVAVFVFIKAFPRLVGEKQFKEHMKLVPGTNRTLSFYEDHVTVQAKFSKKLPYRELKRTGETRHLYILYFTEKRILLIDKNRFRKGNLKELKQFIRKHRTLKSWIFGIIRWIPVTVIGLFFLFSLWTM